MAETGSSFTIRELTGQKRTLSLSQRALPYRPFTLSGTLRAETTWYPGSPVASMQVLGPSEEDTTISGRWTDRYLKTSDESGRGVEPQAVVKVTNAPAPADVFALTTLVDDMRRQGQMIEVTWDEQVRRGIIKQFKQTWQRREICEWELVFAWVAQKEEDVPVAFNRGVSQTSLYPQLQSLADQVVEKAKAGFQLTEDFLTEIHTSMDEIQEAMGNVESSVQNMTDTILDPVDSALSLLGSLGTVQKACQNIVNSVDSRVARTVRNVADVAEITLGEALEAADYCGELKRAAAELRAQAADQGEQLQARTEEQTLLAVFVALENKDLRDISTQFYGTPDEWRRLMSYNGLLSSKLTAGMEILVPRLRSEGTA